MSSVPFAGSGLSAGPSSWGASGSCVLGDGSMFMSMSGSREEGSKDGSAGSLLMVASGLRGGGGSAVEGAGGWDSEGWDAIA